ncbi:GHMP family kinase ATP-binding protein [Phenylobacterium montanum]|uniref:Kinase n=1 Tax=Phenylobacterium montanum TaxID=2823693 RepID=A0A975FXB1_9CAUL|nr:kinase [Caulobacter sp. S6]QUD87010.1 kinase [Caulobacter sp. S6]
MITTRTPLRVSFFGGGTDYPEYYENHAAAVLGTAIDKYVHISAVPLERFMGYGFRLSYRIIEEVQEIDEIEHPVFREVFRMLGLERGWNIGVLTSLPSRSGLGSSSSFTVGLLKLIGHLKNISYTRYDLAQTAIHVEREILKENVGVQDQLHATFGSLNRYDFDGQQYRITPVRLRADVRDAINESMYLVHTGIARFASETVKEQIENTKSGKIEKSLDHLYTMVGQGQSLLESQRGDHVLKDLGGMLHDAWSTKRSLSKTVSTPLIDELYDAALAAGALGGKLCGAGGGGFLLLLIPPERRDAVAAALGERQLIPIRMDDSGSTLIAS